MLPLPCLESSRRWLNAVFRTAINSDRLLQCRGKIRC